MSYKNRKRFIINFTFWALTVAVVMLIFRYVVSRVLPFVVAFAVSTLIHPLIIRVSRDFKVNKKISACFCAFLFYFTGVSVILLAVTGVSVAVKNWSGSLPLIYTESIVPVFEKIIDATQKLFTSFSPQLVEITKDFSAQFMEHSGAFVSDISISAVSRVSGFIAKIPVFLVTVVICVVATFFISLDYDSIVAFILRQLPENIRTVFADIKSHTFSALSLYCRSYLLIMLVTFCELSLGLGILGVNNFIATAFIIAVFDIVPVCGSGGILIPWGIFYLIKGQVRTGIGVLAVYAVITVVRQIIEPKIIGEQVGLPAIVTLMAMFAGARFLGFAGIFICPLAVVVVKRLNDSGRIKIFR